MHGSLALARGVVYVGRCAQRAWVVPYDLDGHPLEGGLSFCDEVGGRSSAAGLAVDDDHRIWVADSEAGRLRSFTLFGRPLADVGDSDHGAGGQSRRKELDERGRIGRPVDVAVSGSDDELELVVASGGRRRHALQILHPASGRSLSLRPPAGPRGFFQGLRGVAYRAGRIYASETAAGRVHVYQGGELHWSLRLPAAGNARFRPTAVAPLEDGSLVVTSSDEGSGALLHCDGGGRLRRVLAEGGSAAGQVDEPLDVVVDEQAPGGARAVVIDQAGCRVQVFTLEGRCFGAFPKLSAG